MIPIQDLPPLWGSGNLTEQVRAAIVAGELTAGYRLPSSRQLARELGLSRRTVVLAFEELCAQGYCISRTGDGTTVAKIPALKQSRAALSTHSFPQWLALESCPEFFNSNPEPATPIEIDFAPGTTQISDLPHKSIFQALKKSLDRMSTQCSSLRRSSNGYPDLIEQICHQVLPMRGIKADPNQILITNGSQNGVALISRLLAPYGGSISYGVPGYLSIPWQFTSQEFTGIPCPVDEDGMRLLPEANSARLHYVMPEHHFPIGVTLSLARRAALLQLAEQQDALILEDDYDSEFYYDRHPLPALKSQDRGGRVIYLGTFSKILFNSLRLGYIVAHPEIIRRLRDLHWLINRGSNIISQLLVAELLESGSIERHLRRMRISYRHRRDLIAAYLLQNFPEWQWQLPQGGMQFWIELPPDELADTVLELGIQRGVMLHSAKLHYEQLSQESLRHLILGFGAVSEAQIHQAFKRLTQQKFVF
jgi:GntR family transcriptional regulator/MocR family aminotransferase